ncbi:MAG: putative peptidoglycan glycosyltransferase FtsW [Eubacteriales bacterium]|nr:putative peptidoglycan glycosyltransferase FtsW [Eubacteriales bacterium]
MARKKTQGEQLLEQRKSGRFSKKNSAYFDYSLLAVIILLTCFGLIMLYSTSSYTAQMSQGDDMFFFKKQAIISTGCIIFAIVISHIDYHSLERFIFPLYFLAAVLMILVRTPLGVTANGARRWLQIGPVQFQPAEVSKIAVIVLLSYLIISMGRNVKTLKGCFVLGAWGGVQALLAYVCTDNLSTAIIIFAITAGLIFVAYPDMKPFIIGFLIGAVLIIILVLYLTSMSDSGGSFRVRRIQVWLHPENFAKDDGYQTLQALYAIGSGGLFGRGLGNSIQKLGSVPEAHNDMIFSIICEELGIFGGVFVLVLFGYLLYRLFFIAQNAPDMFGALLVSGIFIHIALQVILNIAVVVNLLPNTGVTLPFISYGGTSILFLMSEMGLALSVSRKIKIEKTEVLL